MPALCADLRDLVIEVSTSVPRLLALQDRDPDSPTRGCLHPAYWRDKSSEVADMRRQEACLAFAWLWKFPFPGNPWQGDRELLLASLRALGFWTREQHRDGTFDEWYKNEHGYATTAFSSYAVSLTVMALGEALPDPLRGKVMAALERCGQWLSTHDDWFKTNHQAVGVAALGAISRALGRAEFQTAACRNAERITLRMHEEGWSKEISGYDLGYTFLLAEYMAMNAVLTGETRFLPSIRRAYELAAHFLHPELTTGAEYGICANPYFSRVATVALAPHCPSAAAAHAWMGRESATPRDTSSTLKDDLRLARYAYQPLLAALLELGWLERRDLPAAPPAESAPLLFQEMQNERTFPAAKLMAVARPGYAAWVAGVHGGYLRLSFRSGAGFARPIGDRGYVQSSGREVFRTARWSLDGGFSATPTGAVVEVPFVRCAFVQPPYWARVGLHVATTLPYGHRWTRWAIDQWRKRKGTALNQSTAGISGGKSPFQLRREISFESESVSIVDTVRSRRDPIDAAALHLVHDGAVPVNGRFLPDEDRRIPLSSLVATPGSRREWVITKRWFADRCEVAAEGR